MGSAVRALLFAALLLRASPVAAMSTAGGLSHRGDTEQHLIGARFYDSNVGRFISADTVLGSLANPQTLNKYAYVINNPYKYVDPDGHVVKPADDQMKDRLGRMRGQSDAFNADYERLDGESATYHVRMGTADDFKAGRTGKISPSGVDEDGNQEYTILMNPDTPEVDLREGIAHEFQHGVDELDGYYGYADGKIYAYDQDDEFRAYSGGRQYREDAELFYYGFSVLRDPAGEQELRDSIAGDPDYGKLPQDQTTIYE